MPNSRSDEISRANAISLPEIVTENLYHHRPVDEDQTRLLALDKGSGNEQLHATFLTVKDGHLENDAWAYVALSYSRGDGEVADYIVVQDELSSSSKTPSSKLNHETISKRLPITLNLRDALRYFRKAEQPLWIWVDALCVDQENEVEKQQQVMKMPKIYRNASSLCIWLVADNPNEDVAASAMAFIPQVIDPQQSKALLTDFDYLPRWASLLKLLQWNWFSNRWIIQELTFAKTATLYCGARIVHWRDFLDAICILCRDFDILKPWLVRDLEFRSIEFAGEFDIAQQRAKTLLEVTPSPFRRHSNGSYKPAMGLESLVCRLSNYTASDPRDTINAFLSISQEHDCSTASTDVALIPDYSKDLFQVYRDFVRYVVDKSKSLDIICRRWAQPERQTLTPTTPRLVALPSWIRVAKISAPIRRTTVFGSKDVKDSFVGLPGDHIYHASGRDQYRRNAEVEFAPDLTPKGVEDTDERSSSIMNCRVDHMSLLATGVCLGKVSFQTETFADGVITKECLERLGWSFEPSLNWRSISDQLLHTLVAGRDSNGSRLPAICRRVAQHCMKNLTLSGHLNVDALLRKSDIGGYTRDYLERVLAVTSNRSFIQGGTCDKLVGLGPPGTEEGDVIAILYGCSVPAILRQNNYTLDSESFEFVGEAYIYGMMDGEAMDGDFREVKFKLV